METDKTQISQYEKSRDPIHQSDILFNYNVDDDLQGLLNNSPGATPSRNITLISVTPLTKSQKQNAKKKARKERKKLQL
ncbi:hypothetical protein RclHR1_25230001 [Rhizophagus clarus]|nr:hypothetical protein RclHR1_25230001 [Rhizophagus clarus]